MNELALFAGAGGGLLGSRLLGFNTVGACEIDPYARRVLLARQRDGFLDRFPIWADVRTFDGRPWRGSVDVVSGGFPCQDVSASGKGRGLSGDRSSLVFEMLRVVEEAKPRFVFAENSPLLRTRGLGVILEELNRLGYRSAWCVLGAWHVGAPHRRNRMWLLSTNADRESLRDTKQREAGRRFDFQDSGSAFPSDDGEKELMAHPNRAQCERDERTEREQTQHAKPSGPSWWQAEPDVGRVAHGVANRTQRLRAIGNGQVPAVARLAWHILTEMLNDEE